jgi:hypothetical protein
MPASHLWQGRRPPSPPASPPLSLSLSKVEPELSPSPFCSHTKLPTAQAPQITSVAAPVSAAAQARRSRRFSSPSLLPRRRTFPLYLRMVSNLLPPSLVFHVHRSTGARTPARPAPPPFGVGCHDCWSRRLFGSVACASTPTVGEDQERPSGRWMTTP